MAEGQQQTQTFDPDAAHQDYVQNFGGGAGFDPDAAHQDYEQYTGAKAGAASQPETDVRKAEEPEEGFFSHASDVLGRQVKGLWRSASHPWTKASEAYSASRAGGGGVLSSLGKAGLVGATTAEEDPFGIAESNYAGLADTLGGGYSKRRREGYNPVYSALAPSIAPVVGIDLGAMEDAARRGQTKDVLAEAAVPAGEVALAHPAGKLVGAVGDVLGEATEAPREAVAERIARPTVSRPLKAAKADIVHGHAPERAVVGEKISSAADADTRMSQIGQALDNTLIKPEHAGKTVDVQPIIDAAYEKAATNARRAGELGAITRLDAVREALETQHGELGKSPRAAAQMYRDIRKMGVKYGPDPERNIVIQFKKDIADSISSEVKRQVPEARPLMERYGDAASAKEAMEPREIMRRQKGILSATKEGLEEGATRKVAQFIGKQYPKSTLDVPAGGTEPPTLPNGRPSITGGGPNEPSPELRGRRTSTGAIFEEKPTLEEGAGPLARTEGTNPANPALEAPANKQPVMVRMLGEPSRGRAIKLRGETQSVTGGRPIIPGERFALPEAPLEQTETAAPKSALTGVDRAKARVRLAELDKQWDTLNSRLSRSRNYSGSKKTIAKLRSISPERNSLREQFGLGSSEELGEAADPSATYNGLDEDRRAYVDAWAKEIPHLPEILHRETMNELKAFGDPYTPLKEKIAKQLLDYESRKGSREPGEEGPEEPLKQNPSSATAESIRAAQSVTRKTRQSNRHDWRRERGY